MAITNPPMTKYVTKKLKGIGMKIEAASAIENENPSKIAIIYKRLYCKKYATKHKGRVRNNNSINRVYKNEGIINTQNTPEKFNRKMVNKSITLIDIIITVLRFLILRLRPNLTNPIRGCIRYFLVNMKNAKPIPIIIGPIKIFIGVSKES